MDEGLLKTYQKYEKGNTSGQDDMKMIQFSNRMDVLRNNGKVVDVSKEQNYLKKFKELEELKKLRVAKLKSLAGKIDNISKIANIDLKEKEMIKMRDFLNKKEFDEKELEQLYLTI